MTPYYIITNHPKNYTNYEIKSYILFSPSVHILSITVYIFSNIIIC